MEEKIAKHMYGGFGRDVYSIVKGFTGAIKGTITFYLKTYAGIKGVEYTDEAFVRTIGKVASGSFNVLVGLKILDVYSGLDIIHNHSTIFLAGLFALPGITSSVIDYAKSLYGNAVDKNKGPESADFVPDVTCPRTQRVSLSMILKDV